MASLMTLRQGRGLSRKELADRVGVGYQRVWAWETGAAQPRLRHALGLAAALGATPDAIVAMTAPRRDRAVGADAASDRRPTRPRPGARAPAGPPRADARITALLRGAWLSAEDVAARLRVSKAAAYRALWRAEARGLIEHRHGGGYRARTPG